MTTTLSKCAGCDEPVLYRRDDGEFEARPHHRVLTRQRTVTIPVTAAFKLRQFGGILREYPDVCSLACLEHVRAHWPCVTNLTLAKLMRAFENDLKRTDMLVVYPHGREPIEPGDPTFARDVDAWRVVHQLGLAQFNFDVTRCVWGPLFLPAEPPRELWIHVPDDETNPWRNTS